MSVQKVAEVITKVVVIGNRKTEEGEKVDYYLLNTLVLFQQ